jgi:hypothetical protein
MSQQPLRRQVDKGEANGAAEPQGQPNERFRSFLGRLLRVPPAELKQAESDYVDQRGRQKAEKARKLAEGS